MISQDELAKVGTGVSHEKIFQKIKSHYEYFFKNWSTFPQAIKSMYVVSNGCKAHPTLITLIDNAKSIVRALPKVPTLQDSIDLAIIVRSGDFEFLYHDSDSDGVKMGAYARYILDNFIDEV